jgi:general secretion pathway protein A
MYTDFYELREEPFRLTPDPRFLHLAEPHRAVLTTLLEGVILRKGFVVVTGPIGTGKTTLLHAALQILLDRCQAKTPLASAFFVNPTLSRDEFFEALLEEFEVPCSSASKPRRLLALHQMLLETQKQGGTAILLIDEAHLLTPELLEEIRLLNNTDSYREKLLQIVLCGQPELLSLLKRPDMRALQQRISGRGQLRALSVAETRTYIVERLHAAGLRGASPFPHTTLEAIHKYAQGVPRLINLLCDSCLSIGFANQTKHIGLDIVEEAAFVLDLSRSPQVEQEEVFAPTKLSEPVQLTEPVRNTLLQPVREGSALALGLSMTSQEKENRPAASTPPVAARITAAPATDASVLPPPSLVSCGEVESSDDTSRFELSSHSVPTSQAPSEASDPALCPSPSRAASAPVSHLSVPDAAKLREPAKVAGSTMDILIQAMKQNRAAAQGYKG